MRDRFLSYVVCGVLALAFPIGVLAQGETQTPERSPAPADSTSATSLSKGASQAQQPLSSTSVQETASTDLPDSPGAVQAQAQTAQQTQTAQDRETNSAQEPSAPSSQGAGTQSSQTPQDSKPQRPVGTAAAEAPTVSGITAAEPAGVAIAPAKQHRVRTILIRVGAVVGAGVAVGTVVALTEATRSKPPGAR